MAVLPRTERQLNSLDSRRLVQIQEYRALWLLSTQGRGGTLRQGLVYHEKDATWTQELGGTATLLGLD